MNDPGMDFDTLLADRFAREHTQLAADPFVATTMRRLRAAQHRATRVRLVLQVVALLAIVAASPWLIAGAALLNTALSSLFSWSATLPDLLLFGAAALVVATMLAARTRSR